MPGPLAFLLQPVLHQAQTCVDRCLTNWKIGFAALLFVEGLVFGHGVYLIKRLTSSSSSKFSFIFHLGNALSGGVFLAAGLLHIFPEAIALFSGEHGENHEEDNHEEDGHDERWISIRQQPDVEPQGETEPESDEHHSEGFPWAFLVLMLSFYVFFFIENILLPKFLKPRTAKPSQSDEEEGHLEPGDSREEKADAPSHFHGFKSQDFVTALIEILGISAHSFFESMALGLSDSFSTVLNIFIATASHRWATSSAISFKLLRSLNYLPFLALLLLFSANVPIGIGIGAALGNLSDTAQGVLFSISAGTFIYIGCYEVMAEEFIENQQWKLTKFGMTLLGASIIIVVTVILNVLDIHG